MPPVDPQKTHTEGENSTPVEGLPRLIQGRYLYNGEIGRGGMGRVVQVTDLKAGVARALKWVEDNSVNGSAEAIRHLREFHILSRFKHPNLLRVFDYGRDLQTGGYFFTSELLTGPSVRDLILHSALEDRRRVLIELFRALHFLHRQGWVHGDVKPDNLRLRHTLESHLSELCLLDFGLAHPEGRPPEEKILGTVHYMPPERLVGGRIDRRGDLYSAGVLAFQMITGRLPFEEERKTRVFEGQLHHSPPQLRDLVPNVSVSISNLIAALLERRAEDRPSDAEEALRILFEEWHEPGEEATGPETTNTLLAYARVRDTSLWDGPIAQIERRVRERCGEGGPVYRGWLKTAASESSSARPMSAASITASAGAQGMVVVRGQNRGDLRLFRSEVLRRLQLHGHLVLRWNAGNESSPTLLHKEILAHLAGTNEQSEFHANGPIADEKPAPPPKSGGRVSVEPILRDLAILGTTSPVIILVEGAHTASHQTFELLSEVVSNERRLAGLDHVVWITLVDRYPGAWFSSWSAREEVRRWARAIQLPLFCAEGIETFLRTRFPGWRPGSNFVFRLLESSGGGLSRLENQICDHVNRKQFIRTWGAWEAADLPLYRDSPIVRRAQSSLEKLGSEELRLLEVLCVHDEPADPITIQKLAGCAAGKTPEILVSLIDKGWIIRDSQDGTYQFRRRFQAVAVTGLLGPPDRLTLHQKAGDLLEEEQAASWSTRMWTRLARHRVESGQLSKAWGPIVRMLDATIVEGNPGEALRRAEDYLQKERTSSQTVLDDEQRASIHDGIGLLRLRQGDPKGAEKAWRIAEKLYSAGEVDPMRLARLHCRLGSLVMRLGNIDDSLPRLRSSLSALCGKDDADLTHRHLLLIVEAHLIRGEPRASRDLWQRLDQMIEPSDLTLLAQECLLRADHAISFGQHIVARDLLRKGIQRIETGGVIVSGWVAWLLGRLYEIRGYGASARHQYRIAAGLFERQLHPLWEGRALIDFARRLQAESRNEEAEHALLRAERQLRRTGCEVDRPKLLLLRAALLTDEGWVRESKSTLRELEKWGQRFPKAPWRWEGGLVEARLALRTGHLSAAAQLLRGAAHPHAAPHRHQGQIWCRWSVLAMRCALRQGFPRQALKIGERAISEARDSCDAQALQPVWRERLHLFKTLGCSDEAEKLEAQLAEFETDSGKYPAAEGGEEQAERLSLLGKEAESSGDLSRANAHFEEALFHALRVRSVPLCLILPLRLALLRERSDNSTELLARRAWLHLNRSQIKLGRVEVLCLWARARERAEDCQAATKLRRAAIRETVRWSKEIPLSHRLLTLGQGLQADEKALLALSRAIAAS